MFKRKRVPEEIFSVFLLHFKLPAVTVYLLLKKDFYHQVLDHSSVAADLCLALMWNLGLKKVSYPFSRSRGVYFNPIPVAMVLCLGPLDEKVYSLYIQEFKAFVSCERRGWGTGRAPCSSSAAADHLLHASTSKSTLAARDFWLFTYMEASSFSCALPKVRLFCVLSLLMGACHSAIHFTLLPCDLGSLMSSRKVMIL